MVRNLRLLVLATAGTSLLIAVGALAADGAAETVQRDVNQQNRIEQGLKSGQLNTKEAGRLEREESRVDRMESNALKNGSMNAQEKARINRAEDKVSRDIAREKHDAQRGNPDSASSKRMQADVQRNANQQARIEQGVKSGQLTGHETSKLEAQQSRVNRTEARAARNGHVGAGEQAAIQGRENHASRAIHRRKHNAHTAG
jgi:hypothetical protein